MTNDTKQIEPLAVNEREAGRLLGLSGRTVFTLRKAGKIPAVKVGAGLQSRVLYPVEGLRKFLADSTVGAK